MIDYAPPASAMSASLFVFVVGALLVTLATGSRWLVHSDNSGSCSSTNVEEYSSCVENLENALNSLAQSGSLQDNVTLVLARGNHRLTLPVVFTDVIGFSIVAKDDDKRHVIINATVDKTTTESVGRQTKITFHSSSRFHMSNVTVVMLSEGTVFNFTGCQNVKIVDCEFVNQFGVSSAILFANSLDVDIHACHFLFQVSTAFDGIGLEAIHLRKQNNEATILGFVIADHISAPLNNSVPMASTLALSVTNCKFVPKSKYEMEELAGYVHLGEYHISPLSQISLLQVIIAGLSARDINVVISDCYVSGLTIGEGVPTSFLIANKSSGNSILLRNNRIEDNRCISGCGILILFTNNTYNNTMIVSNTTFTNNIALVEGGAVFALLEDLAQVEIENVLLVDNCVFRANRADTFFGGGSSVMIYSNRDFSGSSVKGELRRESTVHFNDCTFIDNIAERAAVYTKDTDVTFTGNW